MRHALRKSINSVLALSLGLGFSVISTPFAYASDDCLPGFTLEGEVCERTYSYSDGAKSFTVPNGLGEIEIEVYGAAAGAGGLDGASCSRSYGGNSGYLFIRYSDLSSKTIDIYPGEKGKDGTSSSGGGAGQGGKSLLGDSYNGGRGGNAGPVGSSGGGGGGGAATVVDVAQTRYVAAGAGAGGGCANSANGSRPGSTAEMYTEDTNGGIGVSTAGNPFSDGGGAGGGGGGVLGGSGGKLFAASGSESGGYGGQAGTNTPVGSKVEESKYVASNTSGFVVLRYFPVLGAKSIEVVTENTSSANSIEYKLTLKSKRDFSLKDIVLSGSAATKQPLKVAITSTKPTKAPYIYYFNVTPRDPNSKLSGTLIASVFDKSSTPIVIDAAGPEATIAIVKSTNNQTKRIFNITFTENVVGLAKEDFRIQGSAKGCQFEALTGEGSNYQISLNGCLEGKYGLLLNANSVADSNDNLGPSAVVSSPLYGKEPKVVTEDNVAPEATVVLQPGSLATSTHVFDVRFDEEVSGMSADSFEPVSGTSTNCEIGYVIGSGRYFQVSLENCTDGTFGLRIKSESAKDVSGNFGPVEDVVSVLSEQSTKATTVTIEPGDSPKEIDPNPVTRVFSELDESTQQAIKEVGVFAPVAGAPVISVVTDLSNSTVGESIRLTSTQQVEVGSSIRLTLNVSAQIAEVSEVVAFMETGTNWQFLGRAPFNGAIANSAEFTIAKLGDFKIRLVIIGKDVVTNMSVPKSSGFGQGLINFPTAVNADETLLSPQVVDLTLRSVEGPNGLPAVVEPEEVPEEVDPTPSVPGAQTDDNAPSQPYDPLGSPEAIKAVAEAVGTAVVVAGAVAGAAAGASGGGARSQSSSQNTDSSEGEISTLDAEVESFTTVKTSWGDRLPIFKLKALTFLDSLTHDLTVRLAKISPVVSKVVNDGAYLRAMFGSMWLALPIAGIGLATFALLQPSVELRPPTWGLFLGIAILGMFDAFAGLLATLVYSVGMISMYGISNLSDVRLMLGVLLLGFGPALIGVAFRAIRKHFETNFAYLWDRLVDLAVLTFFISWSVSAMVATLPALAGRTLAVANYANEFAVWLAIAIAIRIVLEEIAARFFSKRLDKINPTEVPETSQLQKYISTGVRLFLFVFVTAAFMGNVWQVWVGSFIFILPNILGWFEDKFPNSPLLWRILPQGVPGLALTLIVSSASAGVISGWLDGNPEYPQYLFMLLPIPVFLLGLLGMFGREGNEGETRLIMQDKYRWVYRIGGILMLAWTMQLAGVI